jgi:hypothetical protein
MAGRGGREDGGENRQVRHENVSLRELTLYEEQKTI